MDFVVGGLGGGIAGQVRAVDSLAVTRRQERVRAGHWCRVHLTLDSTEVTARKEEP